MITVAVDAMGSDLGPEAVVDGVASLSLEAGPCVLLVGPVPLLDGLLQARRHDPSRVALVHAEHHVRQDDKPREALERHQDVSVLVASGLVASGEAQAVVSAGNTGAFVLGACKVFSRVPGVRRAALAAVHPTEQRHGPRQDPFALMLDVGATLTATAEELVAFAVMGASYSRTISDIERPRVALLSNGTEPGKGTPPIVEAHARMAAAAALPFEFAGNVEGLDVPRGTVDVVVCDGFLGNVVLKMLEGVTEVVTDLANEAWRSRLRWRVGMALVGNQLKDIRTIVDWKQYGGAPLLGLDAVAIKAHGRSTPRAIRNAVKVAAKAAEGRLTERIRVGMESVGAPTA